MAKVRIIDDTVSLRSAPDPTSPVVVELHWGDELTLGKLQEASGKKWVAATMADGRTGFLESTVKIFRVRNVALAQTSVDVFESPVDDAPAKTTYKQGDQFVLVGLPNKGQNQWVEIRSLSGDVGYLRAGAKIKELPVADPQAANDQGLITGCAIAGGGLSFVANFATHGAVPGGFVGGAIGGGLGAMVGILIVKLRNM